MLQAFSYWMSIKHFKILDVHPIRNFKKIEKKQYSDLSQLPNYGNRPYRAN